MAADLLQRDAMAGKRQELAGGQLSPEDEVRKRARERFAEADRILREIDDRWAPPPVDPVLIAQALGYRCVSVDEPGLEDAMIMVQNGTPTILFRRGRSRVRTRFSIFHELAHTLFPDYHGNPLVSGSKARYFGRQGFLEHLCDVAVAEFAMPMDLFKNDLHRAGFTVNSVEGLCRRYGASPEAVSRRMVECDLERCALALVEPKPHTRQRSRRSKRDGDVEDGSRGMKVVGTTYSTGFAARKLFIPTFPGFEKRSCLIQAARSGKPARGSEEVDLGGERWRFDIEVLPLFHRPRVKGLSSVLAFLILS
jgi:Zn-dependent peptidase ImmA (M78 family)